MKKKHLAAGVIVIMLIGLAGFAWIWVAPCALGGCAPLEDLAEYQAEGSELLDINGEPFAMLATVNRKIVSIDSLPAHVPQAFISIEDQRFFSHGGVDLWRTAGALVNNVRSGQVEEGGSTITQQLARNLFPDWLPYTDRNLRRKVMEARVARQIERAFSKEKILELYLNHIYLGDGAYGIEAAAGAYFGKSAAELTLMEAATLAAIPQAPSRVNPKADLDLTTARRDLVLDQMVEAGYLTVSDAAEAKSQPIIVAENAVERDGPASSYFVEQVRRELEEEVGNRFYTAGLKIHTTLDPVAQGAAEEELERQLTAIETGRFGTYRHDTFAERSGEPGQSSYLQGAVVVLDPNTGEIRALVGGRDFDDSKFDRATQALRQPGSAFKPIVYAAALDRYQSPVHQVDDSPLSLTLSGGQVWEPRNYTDQYDGLITMREALTRSKNTATVRLAQEIGMNSVVALARNLGIRSEVPNLPATALGAAEVRPLELVAAYAVFANGGEKVEPHLIREVVDRYGNVVWRPTLRREHVLDPAVAFVLTTMLRDVVDRGTGSVVRAVGFQGPAAGKTGTTNDASDAWFVGYTPDLVAGVWIGLDEPQTIVRGASGGTLAAPVWGRMMRQIYESRPVPEGWPAPSTVVTAEVDRATGAVVSPTCPAQGATYTEYFIRSGPPQQYCPRYDDLRYTWMDSLWVDEEWGEFEYDSLRYSGQTYPSDATDWPELEALRRRLMLAEESLRRSQQAADSALLAGDPEFDVRYDSTDVGTLPVGGAGGRPGLGGSSPTTPQPVPQTPDSPDAAPPADTAAAPLPPPRLLGDPVVTPGGSP